MPDSPVEGGARQKAHYESIHDEYETHYYDPYSMQYRERFIFDPLISGLDLNDRDVLDVASGSGHNTALLRRRFPRMRPIGLDISDAACRAYERNTGCRAWQADLTRPIGFAAQVDAAVVIGGLHHCVTNLHQALTNLGALIKPGGVLLMMEPSSDSALEALRRYWYARDRFFDASTERALSHGALLELAGGAFIPEHVQYIGGPAYFAILNSLVLRLPLSAKRWLTPVTFPMEAAVNALNLRVIAPVFIARWRRR